MVIAHFYMGANSPDGFQTYYNELTIPRKNSRSYLIKGGAGTGKSSIMKRVLNECCERGDLIELIHCSSDPNSLDGIILTNKKISMVDATPPHIIEPTYPGVYQTVVNLCEYFDNVELHTKLDKIVELQTKNNQCHKKCCKLLKCADILLNDNKMLIENYTDTDKIESLAKKIIKKEFAKQNKKATEHKRLLSAITNQGVVSYPQTPKDLAKKIYLIKDSYGISSGLLLSNLRESLIKLGYEFYCCYCPLNQQSQIEHIIIPSLSLAFVTSNDYLKYDLNKINPITVISFTRFTDMSKLKAHKQFISFNKKLSAKLINSAVDTLKKAKSLHDELELQYNSSVDFDRVTHKANEIIAEINKGNG